MKNVTSPDVEIKVRLAAKAENQGLDLESEILDTKRLEKNSMEILLPDLIPGSYELQITALEFTSRTESVVKIPLVKKLVHTEIDAGIQKPLSFSWTTKRLFPLTAVVSSSVSIVIISFFVTLNMTVDPGSNLRMFLIVNGIVTCPFDVTFAVSVISMPLWCDPIRIIYFAKKVVL